MSQHKHSSEPFEIKTVEFQIGLKYGQVRYADKILFPMQYTLDKSFLNYPNKNLGFESSNSKVVPAWQAKIR